MISQTGQYGIRALVYMSEAGAGANVTSTEVAAAAGVPRNYLTKVLNTLVQVGILRSTRGPHGGFRFAVPPADLYLSEVLAPFEEMDRTRCLLGYEGCRHGGDRPHPTRCWRLSTEFYRFLNSTSIADLARGGEAAPASSAARSGERLRPPPRGRDQS